MSSIISLKVFYAISDQNAQPTAIWAICLLDQSQIGFVFGNGMQHSSRVFWNLFENSHIVSLEV